MNEKIINFKASYKSLISTYLWSLFFNVDNNSIKKIRLERMRMLLLRSLPKNRLTLTGSLILFFVFILFNDEPISLIASIAAFGLMYPFFSDLSFYGSYYDVLESTERILMFQKNSTEEYNINLERFQKHYHSLRKKLKNKIRTLCDGNFLSYDYEISRISRDIDVFFDSTTRILFKKKLLTIPYSPLDNSNMFIEEINKQLNFTDFTYKYNHSTLGKDLKLNNYQYSDDTEKPDDSRLWDFKEVDFNMIRVFLNYFGDIVIRKPQLKTLNTIAIGELFRRWNTNIEYLEKANFEETKEDVYRYYNEKNENKRVLFSQIYNIIFLLLIGIVTSFIVQLIFSN